jgi:hypothetical protein
MNYFYGVYEAIDPSKWKDPYTREFKRTSKTYKTLKFGDNCGTSARRFYSANAKAMGWNESLEGRLQFHSWVPSCDGKNDFWCVSHSNLNASKRGQWTNTVDGDFIYEKWETKPDNNYLNPRIVIVAR